MAIQLALGVVFALEVTPRMLRSRCLWESLYQYTTQAKKADLLVTLINMTNVSSLHKEETAEFL